MVWQSQAKSPSSELEGRSKAPSPSGEGRGEGDRDVPTAWIGFHDGEIKPARRVVTVVKRKVAFLAGHC
jgi:hypothetical protein